MINIPWDAADIAYIRNIFSQPSGKKFLELIKRGIPRVTATKMEEVGIEALKKQGAEDLLVHIESLIYAEPQLQEGVDFVNLAKEGD